MPITLQALFAPDRQALQFAVKTLLGGGLALWLALRMDLEQPSWALMTAFIVAQPLSGMVVQKGLARLLGTVVGTLMAVLFMALFAQTPWLFLFTLALWLALCTAASTLLRSAWSYAFVLAGYTVAIIALPAIAQPLSIFDQAVARCTEISLGIFCATVTSAVLWPLRVEKRLAMQARQAWESGVSATRATLLGEKQGQALLDILGRIVAVDAQREHAWFEGNRGRERGRAIRGLSQRLLALLRIARSVRRQWRQLDERQARELAGWLAQVEQALRAPDRAELVLLRQRVWEAAGHSGIGSEQHYCLARMALLLDNLMAADVATLAVEEGKGPADLPDSLAIHRDVSMGLLFGSRSALAFLAMASFWMATAWTSAAGGMLLTCVVCSLFASRENGAQIGMSFIRGICLALPTAFLVGQILLPQWNGFALLALAMGVPLFFGALCMADPKTGATATSYCLHFIVLISPNNQMTFDVATFLNNGLAMLVGVGAAVLAFKLLVFRHPVWQGRRLREATRDDLVRLTQRPLRGAETWFGGRMADRLLQLAHHRAALPQAQREHWDDGLQGLDMGDELLHLRMSLAIAGVASQGPQDTYMERLRAVLRTGPLLEQADALERPSQAFLNALQAQSPSDALRLAQGAVMQLQRSWRQWCRRQEEIDGLA